MSKKAFDAFVRGQAARAPTDRRKELEEWLAHLKSFYITVGGYLHSYAEQGHVRIDVRKRDIIEDRIGPYQADAWDVIIGEHAVQLIPIGTNLIGAKGRVDMTGRGGTVRFVLVDKGVSAPRISVTVHFADAPSQNPAALAQTPIDWAWKIATSPPSIRYLELTEETFFDALLEVANA